MRLFRRAEPLHVQLARAGGLTIDEDSRPRAPWDESGIHGLQRLREWDVVVTVAAPELDGDRSRFVSLEDGRLVVEDGPPLPTPLAEALDRELARPFRVDAVRRDPRLWAVAARRIEVRELPAVRGDEVELSLHDGERTLVIDGRPEFGSIPALERANHVVRARRVDGELWEVAFDPL